MIAKGSWKYIFPFFSPILLIPLFRPWGIYISIISSFFGIYLIWFFRDPKRKIEKNGVLIYSAADGTVIKAEIEQREGNFHLNVAVRMSPFDVHLIRAPYDMEIEEIMHTPGKHKSVYFAGAEQKNERKLIQAKSEIMDIEILLLTGAFARRIDTWVKIGERIGQGEKIGIIRFGSQTNLRITTKRGLTLMVKEGDKVNAGITALAKVE